MKQLHPAILPLSGVKGVLCQSILLCLLGKYQSPADNNLWHVTTVKTAFWSQGHFRFYSPKRATFTEFHSQYLDCKNIWVIFQRLKKKRSFCTMSAGHLHELLGSGAELWLFSSSFKSLDMINQSYLFFFTIPESQNNNISTPLTTSVISTCS